MGPTLPRYASTAQRHTAPQGASLPIEVLRERLEYPGRSPHHTSSFLP